MSDIVKASRNAKEKLYGTIALVLGGPLWIVIGLGFVAGLANDKTKPVAALYLFYAIAAALFVWIGGAAYRASAFGNMVLLSETQLPALHAMVLDGARRLGLSPPPKAFLFNSNGILNAYARRLVGGRYVFLTSALIDVESDEEVRFVIGHELGHHAAGHLNPWWHILRLPAVFVPYLMPAYSRAREYTCDQIGARLTGDAAVSQNALLMLGCGCARVKPSLNCEAFMAQEKMVPPLFGFLNEIWRSHPRLTRRLLAVNGASGKIVQ